MADTRNPPPPSSLSEAVPSSFDDSPEFFEEKRLGKLWRRLKEEPLIPVGCAATMYALYQASKSIRAGDHHQSNYMFRARIYAQGFTLVALVAGSIFYKDERLRRKRFESVLEDKKAAEKREKWLKELEMRDKEDREWRARFEGVAQRAKDAEDQIKSGVEKGVAMAGQSVERSKDSVQDIIDKAFPNKSVMEKVERSAWGRGRWLSRTSDAWRRI